MCQTRAKVTARVVTNCASLFPPVFWLQTRWVISNTLALIDNPVKTIPGINHSLGRCVEANLFWGQVGFDTQFSRSGRGRERTSAIQSPLGSGKAGT